MNKPCPTCPWRESNHGRDKPDFMLVEDGIDPFSEANAKRLWHGIRKGEAMNCHAKDSNQGGAGDGETPCFGAIGLVMNELNLAARDKKAYRKSRGGFAMTKAGIASWVSLFTIGRMMKVDGTLVLQRFPHQLEVDEPLGVQGTNVCAKKEE